MSVISENKGLVIFGILAIVAIAASIAAYSATGSMGIEERFNTAVGLENFEHGSSGGFSLEGNPVLYSIILGILIVICYGAYRLFGKNRN